VSCHDNVVATPCIHDHGPCNHQIWLPSFAGGATAVACTLWCHHAPWVAHHTLRHGCTVDGGIVVRITILLERGNNLGGSAVVQMLEGKYSLQDLRSSSVTRWVLGLSWQRGDGSRPSLRRQHPRRDPGSIAMRSWEAARSTAWRHSGQAQRARPRWHLGRRVGRSCSSLHRDGALPVGNAHRAQPCRRHHLRVTGSTMRSGAASISHRARAVVLRTRRVSSARIHPIALPALRWRSLFVQRLACEVRPPRPFLRC
jgi:hypothetical protein